MILHILLVLFIKQLILNSQKQNVCVCHTMYPLENMLPMSYIKEQTFVVHFNQTLSSCLKIQNE